MKQTIDEKIKNLRDKKDLLRKLTKKFAFKNKTEALVKHQLELDGYWVFKPSYPDFLVYSPVKDNFFFIEVKRTGGLSESQKYTFDLLKVLGFEAQIINTEKSIDLPKEIEIKEEMEKTPVITKMKENLSEQYFINNRERIEKLKNK